MSLEFATLLLEMQCVAFICLGLFVQRRACILKFEIVSVQEQFDMRSKMAHDYCRQEEGQKEREKEQQQNARMMTARKGLLQGALYIVNASVNRTVVCGCGQQQSLGCLCRHLKRCLRNCSSIQSASWLVIPNFAVWSHQFWQYHHSDLQCKTTTARAKAFSINAAIRHTVQCMAAISKLEFIE